MNKFFDKLAIIIIAFFGIIIILTLAKFELWAVVTTAFIFCSILALFLARQQSKNSTCMTYSEYITYCVVQGNDYVKSAIISTHPQLNWKVGDDFLIVGDTIIFLWIKFGNLSPDTLVKFYHIAKRENSAKVYVLTTSKDKKIISFSKSFGDIIFCINDIKELYKFQKSCNFLPQNTAKKMSFKQIFLLILSYAFSKKYCKRYLFVAIILLLMSFLTPLKTYYLISAAVCLLLATCCLIPSDFFQRKGHKKLN
ncbi:MAG: hypothetical protein RR416_02035 [Clostridia bacterium]